MKFTDHPRDLQRIVELTPDGWGGDASDVCVELGRNGVFYLEFIGYDENSGKEFTRAQYEQCRAQWLAEKGYVDWRGLCEELAQWLNRANRIGIDEWNRDAIDRVLDKARKALEKTN